MSLNNGDIVIVIQAYIGIHMITSLLCRFRTQDG